MRHPRHCLERLCRRWCGYAWVRRGRREARIQGRRPRLESSGGWDHFAPRRSFVTTFALLFHFLTAIISISTRAPGVARPTFTVERAGLLGWAAVPKGLDHSRFMAGKSMSPPLAGSPTRKTVAFTTSPKVR